MYKWFQKNNKYLLAFIMIFLMIAFLLPSTFQGCDPARMAIGTVYGRRITEPDAAQAYQEYNFVRQNIFVPTVINGQQSWQPLIYATTLRLADRAIEENKLMYFLLREEARQLGVILPPSQLDLVLAQVGFRLPDNRIVDFDSVPNRFEKQYARQALANVLSVEAAFARALANIKVSEPQRKAEAAMQLQTLTLGLVPFNVDSYLAQAPAPSRQQMMEQFEKYADTLAGQASRENPFGFGYKFPDRVKLQYLLVKPQAVREAVLAQKSDYDWEVEARRYYISNPSAFPTTQQAATQPGATTQTVTVPFEQVRQQAIDAVVQPKVQTLTRMVQQRILLALNNGFAAWTKNNARVGDAAAPTTSPEAPYDSFEYLQALATDVQRQFGVVATVVNLGDRFRNRNDLASLGEISAAEAMIHGRAMPLAEYVFSVGQVFLTPEARERDQAFALQLFQPSQTLTMPDGGFALIRLTAAEAAHRPASLDEVAQDVERDLKLSWAYDMARSEARKLLEAAGSAGLDSAAASSGRLVLDSGPLRLGRSLEIPGLALSAGSQRSFALQAFDLLAEDRAGRAPVGLIELPAEGMVIVAELRDVRSSVTPELLSAAEAQIVMQSTLQLSQELASAWFNYENVMERTGFKDVHARTEAARAQ
ncbi:MAG: hypothetical protein RMJ35_07665 [Phycisphaerales bacterium]|nr:hypothetical protein [Phycisphaerales bacterium]